MNKIIRALLVLLLPLTSMGALTVNNGGGATNITSTSAWITATIVSTGAANPYLYSYWGTNSGGTNATSWGHTNSYGLSTQAAYSAQITGLSGSTIYYFRTHATNTYDTTNSESAWAPYTAQFITLTTPTSAPPSSVRAVTVDTNAVLKNPTNFFTVNSNAIKTAISYTGISEAFTNVIDGGREGDGSVTVSDRQVIIKHPAPTAVTGAVTQIAAGGGIVVTPEGGQGYVGIALSNDILASIAASLTNEPEFTASPAAGISADDLAAWRGGSNWSGAPATHDVNMASHGLSNVAYMSLGGDTRTNWPVEYDPSAWSQYPAEDDVDVNNLTLYNVAWIQLGGVYRDSWPAFTNWADGPASADVDLAGHTLSNGAISGCTIVGYATNDHLHAQYLTNSSGWSGFGATQTVNMANYGLQNVAAIGLGGVTYSNWPHFNSTQFFAKINLGNTNLFTNLVSGAPWPLNIKGTDSARAQMSIIGGIMTTNQVSGLPGYAEQYTNSLTPRMNPWGYSIGLLPVNLCVQDGMAATAHYAPGGYPNYTDIIRLNTFNFNIPLNAVVQGIKVEIEAASYAGSDTFTMYFRLRNNSITSAVYSVEELLTGTTSTWGSAYSYGSTNTLWGLSPFTPAEVNADDFGIELWTAETSAQSQNWIFLRNPHITVFYTSDELAWTHGVNAAGEYTIRNERIEKDILTLGSNGMVQFPQLTLGGETRTNWPAGGDVSSVFGRTGDVTAEGGDYAAYYAGTGDLAQTQSDIVNLKTATNVLENRVADMEGNTGVWNQAAADASAATAAVAKITVFKTVNTATTAGKVYQLSAGIWNAASCTNDQMCNRMIAVAVGTNSAQYGMLIQGEMTVTNDDLSVGAGIYVAAPAGEWTQVVPTNSGYVIRLIGYATATNKLFFRPDGVWGEVK